MLGTHAIDVVSDASVAVTWFHAEGEQQVGPARRLLDAHRDRTLRVALLDLTLYELGNALQRGPARFSAEKLVGVLAFTRELPVITPAPAELELSAALSEEHGLTFYDAAYAAVAKARGFTLVTLDRKILAAGLGEDPAALVERLGLTA